MWVVSADASANVSEFAAPQGSQISGNLKILGTNKDNHNNKLYNIFENVWRKGLTDKSYFYEKPSLLYVHSDQKNTLLLSTYLTFYGWVEMGRVGGLEF